MSLGRRIETSARPAPPRVKGWRIQKTQKPRRQSARLRAKQQSKASPSIPPLQEPSHEHQDPPARRRLKRPRPEESPHRAEIEAPSHAKDLRPPKRQRTSIQSISDRSLPLTERNLRTHNNLFMDIESYSSGGRRSSKRRASSTRTESVRSTSTGTRETSQRSSGTSAHYRHVILRKAGLQIHTPIPGNILSQINAVIQRKVSPERKRKLSVITQELNNSFIQIVAEPAGEDDCIEPFYNAISSMDSSKRITFPRKADWRPNLKPRFKPPPSWISALPSQAQNKTTETVDQPSKRQQVFAPYLSPGCSVATNAGPVAVSLTDKALETESMLPPPLPPPPPQQDIHSIKTPRPDISVGLHYTTLVNALQSQGLTKEDGEALIDRLQETNSQSCSEPMVCSMPTQRDLNIRFPFLLVEGKAYATGSAVFDAENQAAVSGACALKILHDLDDLVGRSRAPSKDQPLVFSVCTEGPYHELWAHYSTLENDFRKFNMVLLKTCNAVVHDELQGFLQAVDNVMSWAVDGFLRDIATQLGDLAMAAKAAKLSR